MNEKGFTLTEVLIAVGILSIVLAIAGMSFSTFTARYRMENQVRELYTDFNNARARAMQRNLDHIVVVTTSGYSVVEDANDDGDPSEAAFINKPLAYPPAAAVNVTLNKRGLVKTDATIRFSSGGAGAVLDCIALTATRIRMGKWDGTTCTAQ